MKTVFDTTVREELITRIHSLTSQNNAQWGKCFPNAETLRAVR
jgi:hypothetical protein